MRQLLPLVPWDDVNVQVENFLPCRVSVLLDDGDSVGFRGVLDGDGGSLDESVDVSNEVIGNVVNSLIMLSGNDERVPLVQRSDIKKRHYIFVFVHDASKRLFPHYLAKDA